MRPNLVASNPLWITNSHSLIVINFYQDFVESIHSDLLQGQMERELSYRTNIVGNSAV